MAGMSVAQDIVRDAIKQAVDMLVVSHCKNVEYEVDHVTSMRGGRWVRGLMIQPSQQEFGLQAIVIWGMMHIAEECSKHEQP